MLKMNLRHLLISEAYYKIEEFMEEQKQTLDVHLLVALHLPLIN